MFEMDEIEKQHALNVKRWFYGDREHELRMSAMAELLEMWQDKLQDKLDDIREMENILTDALYRSSDRDDCRRLGAECRLFVKKPQPLKLLDIPKPPNKNAPFYKNYPKRYAENMFKSDYDCWLKDQEEILIKNKELEKQYQDELNKWEEEERNLLVIQQIREQYFNNQPNAIIPYFEIILTDTVYPHYFSSQIFSLKYNPTTKILIVDSTLPSVDDIHEILVGYSLSESAFNKIYDNLIYQFTLRTIHELYESDVISVIDSIVFNGGVSFFNKATGQAIYAYIISLQANRQEFLSINLEKIDPKLCFEGLKGVGNSELHSLTPIEPILDTNWSREDKTNSDEGKYYIGNGTHYSPNYYLSVLSKLAEKSNNAP